MTDINMASGGIPQRTLGKTGDKLSIIGFGGIVVMGDTQEAANRVVHEAMSRGVNYFDVAPSYGSGEAEEKLGKALIGHRDRVFLACKTGERNKEEAKRELETSLKRLHTDHFDLYQMHGFSNIEEVHQAFGPGGAIEAFVEARDKGQVRNLGFSAHSVDAALGAMEKFTFDTILFPFNWVSYTQADFGPQVLLEAQKRGMGCLALKGMAYSSRSNEAGTDYPNCWYQPISDPALAELALRFTLSLPITAAIPPGDERLFRLAMDIAERYKPLAEEEMAHLNALAENVRPIFTNRC